MSFSQRALALLRRPTAPVAPAQVSPTRRPTKAPAPADLPVTEDELRTALDACFPARQAAETAIATAAARRETLLLSDAPDADEQLLDLDREINLAAIQLERLDLLEPALYARLRAISGTARRERFLALRDEVVAAAQAALPALREAAHANEKWKAVQNAALLEFPDVANFMPGIIGIDLADVRQFADDVEKFRRTDRRVKPVPFANSAAEMTKEAIESGRPLDEFPTIGAEIAIALGPDVLVTLIRSTTAPNGRKLAAGTEIMVSPLVAQELIATGRAKTKDKK